MKLVVLILTSAFVFGLIACSCPLRLNGTGNPLKITISKNTTLNARKIRMASAGTMTVELNNSDVSLMIKCKTLKLKNDITFTTAGTIKNSHVKIYCKRIRGDGKMIFGTGESSNSFSLKQGEQ